MNIGETIKARRKKLGLSQEAAARAADVSWATWNRWENGVMKPNLDHLESIASALRLSTSKLIK